MPIYLASLFKGINPVGRRQDPRLAKIANLGLKFQQIRDPKILAIETSEGLRRLFKCSSMVVVQSRMRKEVLDIEDFHGKFAPTIVSRHDLKIEKINQLWRKETAEGNSLYIPDINRKIAYVYNSTSKKFTKKIIEESKELLLSTSQQTGSILITPMVYYQSLIAESKPKLGNETLAKVAKGVPIIVATPITADENLATQTILPSTQDLKQKEVLGFFYQYHPEKNYFRSKNITASFILAELAATAFKNIMVINPF